MAGKEDEKALAFLDSLYQEELEEQDEPAVLSKSQVHWDNVEIYIWI